MKTPDEECRSWHAPAKTPGLNMSALFRDNVEVIAKQEAVLDERNIKRHGLGKSARVFSRAVFWRILRILKAAKDGIIQKSREATCNIMHVTQSRSPWASKNIHFYVTYYSVRYQCAEFYLGAFQD